MTADVYLYDVATGEVLQRVTGEASAVAAMTSDTIGSVPYVDGTTTASHYIVDGVLTSLPARPSRFHVWDWKAKAWADPRTLADIKKAKVKELADAQAAAITATVTFKDKPFQTDDRSRLLLLNFAAANHNTVAWDMPDGSVETLTRQDINALIVAMADQAAGAAGKARALKASVNAAKTKAEAEAVHWQ